MNEDDFGPTSDLGGARRDPALSIRREPPPRPPNPLDPTRRESAPTSSGWIARLVGSGALILFMLVAVVIVLTLAGILAHLNWNILVWAWRLVP